MTGSCLLHVSGVLSLTDDPGISRPASPFTMSKGRVVGRCHRSRRLLEITTHVMIERFLINARKIRSLYDHYFWFPSYSSRARPSLKPSDTFIMESTFCPRSLTLTRVSINYSCTIPWDVLDIAAFLAYDMRNSVALISRWAMSRPRKQGAS